jgi:hypothetical protein
MFRITLKSTNLPTSVGASAPPDLEAEFLKRDWHQNPRASWDGEVLRLTVDNDFDTNGLATLDEFADALQICLDYDGDLEFDVESIESF